MTLEEARCAVGRRVVYENTAEHGVIDDTGRLYVFVLYDGQRGAKATAPELLTWES